MKSSRTSFLLGALAGAAIAALVVALVGRRSPAPTPPYAIAPPEGGETEGEHQLFVG